MKDKYCCESFKLLVPSFKWMICLDVYVMPYMQVGVSKLRVNHCPSCGTEVRDIELTEI